MALLSIDELDARNAGGVFYPTPGGGWLGGQLLKVCSAEQLHEMAATADAIASVLGTVSALLVVALTEEGYGFKGSEELLPFAWRDQR